MSLTFWLSLTKKENFSDYLKSKINFKF